MQFDIVDSPTPGAPADARSTLADAVAHVAGALLTVADAVAHVAGITTA